MVKVITNSTRDLLLLWLQKVHVTYCYYGYRQFTWLTVTIVTDSSRDLLLLWLQTVHVTNCYYGYRQLTWLTVTMVTDSSSDLLLLWLLTVHCRVIESKLTMITATLKQHENPLDATPCTPETYKYSLTLLLHTSELYFGVIE